jgi:nicotinate-nucleotide pyrophosphorylase (carboxylating)
VEGPDDIIAEIVERALKEDAAESDSTTVMLAGEGKVGRAVIRARAPGTVSGQRCARAVFSRLDPSVLYDDVKRDGSSVVVDEIVAVLEGSLRAILTGERTALNFLQHLSGVATSVRRFVEQVEGTGAVILDTRKTIPGLRVFEKEAVRHGGGSNHRKDLADLVLVKENHILTAGGIDRVIDLLGARIEEAEIEVSSLEELRKLREIRPWRIMLDNFTPDGVRAAMEELRGWPRIPGIEVSGGVTIETVKSYAALGVEYISVGAVTSSAPALDMSLIVEEVG